MAEKTEGRTPGDFLMFEEDAHYSRAKATIAAGADLEPGTVLGQITASGKYVACDPGAVDGSEAAKAVLLTPARAASADVTDAVLLSRHAQVRRLGLTFGAGFSTSGERNAAVAELEAEGIQVL